MAKMAGKKAARMGSKSKTVGDSKDGARPSVKHQVSGKTKGNAITPPKPKGGGRMSRIAKMERADPAC